jgi:methylated-DNA-[protein]-cysteine S-methyltransferase
MTSCYRHLPEVRRAGRGGPSGNIYNRGGGREAPSERRRRDFSDVAIDIGSLAEFDRAVLEATRRIPRGETRTYGEIAVSLGAPGAARAVGTALGRNPIPIIVPCHRVLAAGGASGGFSAPGGRLTKLKILEIERARRGPEPGLFDHLPWAVRTQASEQS